MAKNLLFVFTVWVAAMFPAQAPTVQWVKSNTDYSAGFVMQASDGGFITVGSDILLEKPVLKKFTTDGTLVWTKEHTVGNGEVGAGYINKVSDGGFTYLSASFGTPLSQLFVNKTDASGNLLWSKEILTTGSEEGFQFNAISRRKSGGFIIAGAGNDHLVVSVNASGLKEWEKEFDFMVSSARETSDGGYILSGMEEENKHYVYKLDAERNVEWRQLLTPSIFQQINYVQDVQQTASGAYVVMAYVFNGEFTINQQWVARLHAAGNLDWDMAIDNAVADHLLVLQNGDFLLVAENNFVRYNGNGQLMWHQSYQTLAQASEIEVHDIMVTDEGGYVYTASAYDQDAEHTQLVKLGADPLSVASVAAASLKIFPNPVKEILNFPETLYHIKIFGMDGKLIFSDSAKQQISVSALPKGLYTIQAENGRAQKVQTKMIKD